MARSKKCHERLAQRGGKLSSPYFIGLSGFHRYIGISSVSQDSTGISGFHRRKLPSPLAGRGWGGAIRDDGRRNRIIFIQVI